MLDVTPSEPNGRPRSLALLAGEHPAAIAVSGGRLETLPLRCLACTGQETDKAVGLRLNEVRPLNERPTVVAKRLIEVFSLTSLEPHRSSRPSRCLVESTVFAGKLRSLVMFWLGSTVW